MNVPPPAGREGENLRDSDARHRGLLEAAPDAMVVEKILGMFQRLHRRDDFAGTGIGLAICQKIVERHGGTISVESRPEEGSTFRFALTGGERIL